MNSVVGSIFNEKVTENGICGPVNSAQVHCSRLTWSNSADGKKKKKNKQKMQPRIQRKTLNPNGHIIFFSFFFI